MPSSTSSTSAFLPGQDFIVSDDKIVLRFEGMPPGLNKTKGHHWGKTNKERVYWRNYAKYIGQACKARVIYDKAHLHFHLWLGDNRRRDEDNLRGGMKPVVDGLVDAGVIEDDSIQKIETKYTFDTSKGPQRFEITITSL